ncbi:MAG: amidohydrolase family protein [Methanosarcinaceae archaeon]|nr:amidohydrolase family protein [Methanosarcinaceae archaeon]
MSFSQAFEQRILDESETEVKLPEGLFKKGPSNILKADRDAVAPEKEALVPEGVIDMHLHYVDFLQQTDGMKALIREMDRGNIAKTVLFGLPVKKKWEYFEPNMPHYYLDDNSKCYYYALTDRVVAEDYEKLSPAEKKRIAPTLCGFNPTDKFAIDYVKAMFKKSDIWKGVGELLLRHDDLTNLTLEETARSNHPGLEEVFKFCARKRLPVNIHQNSTSVGNHEDFEYLHEIEAVLDHYRKLKLVWAHCGASRRVIHKKYWEMVDGMLENHRNLQVDLSWIVYDDIVCKENSKIPKEVWVELITKYPDRFMIGSDLCGHFNYLNNGKKRVTLGKTMARYNTLVSMLPADVARKLVWENANKLWFS